jgi:hypothetical protein
MDHEEQLSQAGDPAAPAAAGASVVEKLEALGVRGILLQLARDGQILDVRCEMPPCYCFRGRRYFDPRSPRSDWSPTPDHHPRLRAHGGHLTRDNVRLAHLLCNRRGYGWRMKINAMLEEADVAGGDRRATERTEGSADPRREQMDGYLCTEGISFRRACVSKSSAPAVPRPTARVADARSRGRESADIRAGTSRPLAGLDHRALHARRAGAVPRGSREERGADVRRAPRR